MLLFQVQAYYFNPLAIGSKVNHLIVENLLVSLLLAAMVWVLVSRTRRGIFIAVSLLNIFIFIDFIFYKIFLQHLSSYLVNGYVTVSPINLNSIFKQLDGWFYLNLLVLGSVLLLFHRSLLSWQPLYTTKPRNSVVVGLILVSISLVATTSLSDDEGYRHPIAVYTHDIFSVPSNSNTLSWPSPIHHSNIVQADLARAVVDPSLNQLLTAARSNPEQLNIVLVILESVGAMQLLNERGEISATQTPTLEALSQRGVLFDALYSPLPNTLGSHIALNTGEITIGATDALSAMPQGPTLAGTLRDHGYRTALFSSADLSFENMDSLYTNMGYDKIYDFAKAPAAFQAQHRLHSRGGKEEAVLGLATDWMGDSRLKKPFFVTYISNATRPPFSVPDSYKGISESDDERSRYANALHYTDHALEKLLFFLDDHQLTANTLVVVMGDHGITLADAHHHGVPHTNYLHEENIKSFLLIANPRLIKTAHTSHRVAAIVDVMPTLLSLANIDEAQVPGQNLLSHAYSENIQYFFNNTALEIGGLRDRNWKFIAEKLANTIELYNLSVDDMERTNIAANHPDKVAIYRNLTSRQYPITE